MSAKYLSMLRRSLDNITCRVLLVVSSVLMFPC